MFRFQKKVKYNDVDEHCCNPFCTLMSFKASYAFVIALILIILPNNTSALVRKKLLEILALVTSFISNDFIDF